MSARKEKLLVLELWGLGDLAMAHDFLKSASDRFDVTLVAKPHAETVCNRFWKGVELAPFTAPWTAFKAKYHLWKWPWRSMRELLGSLRERRFDVAVSARLDPRDHWFMWRAGARRRVGYPRAGGGVWLTDRLHPPAKLSHRYAHWRGIAEQLDIPMPPQEEIRRTKEGETGSRVIVHSGAAQDTRVWPIERFVAVMERLRGEGLEVEALCDPRQAERFKELGEKGVCAPASIEELLNRIAGAAAFVGNDSGPGHWAAIMGVPTFTVYGPVYAEMFGPLHPLADGLPGAPCPYRPCFDSCRFETNRCMVDLEFEAVWGKLKGFIDTVVSR